MPSKRTHPLIKWLKDRMPGVWENVLASTIISLAGLLLVIFWDTLVKKALPFLEQTLTNIEIDGNLLSIVIILVVLGVGGLLIRRRRAALDILLQETPADDFQAFKFEIKRTAGNQGLTIVKEAPGGLFFLARSKSGELSLFFIEPNSQVVLTRRTVGRLLKLMARLNCSSGKYISRTTRDFFNDRKILDYAKNKLQFTDYANYVLAGIDFSKHLEDLINNWQASETSNLYIETMGRDQDGRLHPVLDKALDVFMTQGKGAKGNFIVLGDFGSGKTTFLRYYACLLARRYVQSPFDNLIPVFISLREFEVEGSIGKLIAKTLGISVETLDNSANLLRDKWILILDAFDEMSLQVDRVSVQRNIQRIEDIATHKNGALLVSCRTHFFRDSVEEDQLVDFRAIYLEPWKEEAINEYLKKSLGAKWKQAKKVINNTYNLLELAQTPLFLDMTIDSIDSIHGKKIYSAELYKIYTRRWITKQIYKAVLDSDQKQEFMEEIAWKMLNEGRAFIPWTDLRNDVQKRFHLQLSEVDRFDNDIRTCSFLTRQELGYAFVHKSFMEFFLASYFAKKIMNDDIVDLCKIELSPEAIAFLGQMVDELIYYERLHLWLEFKVEAEYALARRNTAHTLRAISRLASPDIPSLENRMSSLIDIALSNREETSRWRAIVELSWLRSSNSKNILRKILASEERDIRVIRMAALALGLLADEEALPVMTRLLTEGQHFTIRQNCAVALGLSRLTSAIPSLIDSLVREADYRVRRSTIWALESIDPVAARTPLTTSALQDPSEEVRQYAAMAFGRLGGGIALEVLERQLIDESPMVRKAAIDSLGKIGGPSANELIKGCVNDPDFGVREACKHALNLMVSYQ